MSIRLSENMGKILPPASDVVIDDHHTFLLLNKVHFTVPDLDGADPLWLLLVLITVLQA
jgi:hypothetical protein